MTIANLLLLIDAQIAKLEQARALLSSPASEKRKPGRPAGSTVTPKEKAGGISPEGRARIAAAQKERWAKQKKAAKA
jgi:hypothetical protein